MNCSQRAGVRLQGVTRPQLNFHTSLCFLCTLFAVTAHRACICTHKAHTLCAVCDHMGSVEEAGTLAVADLLCYLGTSERAYFWLPVKTLKCKLGSYLGYDGGTCLFHWHLDNECVYMYNEMLVTVKNQLIIKTQEDFETIRFFLWFCRQNVQKTCTH